MSEEEKFIEAIRSGNLKAARILLDQDSNLLHMKSEMAPSLVLLAMYYGQPGMADLLIERGAVPDIFDAAASGRLEIVKKLVSEQPGSANAFAMDGYQPLGLACFFGHRMVVEFLLSKEAEVNSPSHNRMHVMPLHSAVAHQDLAISRMLLEHGADVNATQADDSAPMHEAAGNGQLEMVQLLIEFGAEVNQKMSDGRTPLAVAEQAGHIKVMEFLKAHGGV